MSRPPLKITIIGGGIGGLFAANALIAKGLEVSVYEQAPELGEIGAGFFLTPNSVRQLQRVGLGSEVEKIGALVGWGSQYLRHDGTPIAPVQTEDANGWNATYGMHRADMIELLAGGFRMASCIAVTLAPISNKMMTRLELRSPAASR